MAVTRNPRVFSNNPVEEAITPFPMPLMTPPETRTYFIVVGLYSSLKGEGQSGRMKEGREWPLCAKIVDRVLT
jgi:hypothetical protein